MNKFFGGEGRSTLNVGPLFLPLIFGMAVLFEACGGGSGSVQPPAPSTSAAPIGTSPVLSMPANPSFEVPSSSTSDNWPTYAHDVLRTGFEPNATGITQATVANLHLAWTFKSSSGAQFSASPILYDGVLYTLDENGELTALNAQTGSVIWQDEIGLWTEMTPAIYDGILFVGLHDYPSQLIALDPLTGNRLWSQTVPGGLQGSPVAVNGVIYSGVGLGDAGFCHPGGVYAFDEKSGSPGSIWLTEAGSQADGGAVWAPLSYDGQRILFGTGNTCNAAPATANAIVSVAPDLSQQWFIPTAAPNDDSDVGGGVLVLGQFGFAMAKSGYFYSVDLSDGQTEWKENIGAGDGLGGHMTPGYTESTLIISGGFLTFPDGQDAPGGTLYGLGLDGTVKWKRTLEDPIISYVATTPDLAFATLGHSISALNPKTGATIWTYPTSGDFHGGPVVTSAGLFAADLSGTVYAFTLTAGQTTPARRLAAGRVPSRSHVSVPKYCRLGK